MNIWISITNLILLILSFLFLKFANIKVIDFKPINIYIYGLVLYVLIAFILISIIPFIPNLENILRFFACIPEEYINKISLLVFLCFFCFSFGVFISRLFFFQKCVNNYIYIEYKNKKNRKNCVPILLLFCIAIFFLEIVFFCIYRVPLFSHDVEVLRFKMLTSGGWYFIFPIWTVTLPVIYGLAYFLFLNNKRNFKIKIIFIFSLFLYSLSILTGFRSFLIVAIIISGVIYSIYKKISVQSFLKISVLVITIIILVTYFKYKFFVKENPILLLHPILHRTVFESTCSLYYTFKVIDDIGFLWGKTYLMDLYSKLPGNQLTFRGLIAQEAGLKFFGTLTPTLIGELWANFSYFTLFIFIFFGFFMHYFSNILFIKIKKNFSLKFVGLYLILSLFSLGCVTGGFSNLFNVFFQVAVLFSVLMFCFIFRKVKNV